VERDSKKAVASHTRIFQQQNITGISSLYHKRYNITEELKDALDL
jgi:hypothetical protein